jgi:hypothetical protein
MLYTLFGESGRVPLTSGNLFSFFGMGKRAHRLFTDFSKLFELPSGGQLKTSGTASAA